jgi:vacuolar protein sorting-associated protein 13B
VTIHDDSSPFIAIRNDTDFNLYVAQVDAGNPEAHREVPDDRLSWFQPVPSKQEVFYTPPIVNEHFPEITNSDYSLVLACVTGDDTPRWSQPIKIDETKKIITNVPMFGDVKLTVDDTDKTARITINYVKNEAVEVRREVTRSSLHDINSCYQKTFSVARKPKKKVLNLSFYSRGVSFTVFKDTGKQLISLNLDDIGVMYSKLSRKLAANFSKIQVDNELFSTGDFDFPVVVCNKDPPKFSGHQLATTSVWDLPEILEDRIGQENFAIDFELYGSGGIEKIAVKLQPVRVYIEDTFINVFLEMVDDCMLVNLMPKNEEKEKKIKLENGLVLVPLAVVGQTQVLAEPIRLKSIRIEPLHVLLSVHTCMR